MTGIHRSTGTVFLHGAAQTCLKVMSILLISVDIQHRTCVAQALTDQKGCRWPSQCSHVGAAGLLTNCPAHDPATPCAQDFGKGNVPIHKGPHVSRYSQGLRAPRWNDPHRGWRPPYQHQGEALWRVLGATRCRVPRSERSLRRFSVKRHIYLFYETIAIRIYIYDQHIVGL